MARPRSNRRTVRLSVSLDETVYAAVLSLAREQDVSAAWVVRRAVNGLVAERSAANDSASPAKPLMRRGRK
jgi:hypothetical protein